MWPEGLGEDGANIAQERSGLSTSGSVQPHGTSAGTPDGSGEGPHVTPHRLALGGFSWLLRQGTHHSIRLPEAPACLGPGTSPVSLCPLLWKVGTLLPPPTASEKSTVDPADPHDRCQGACTPWQPHPGLGP